MASTVGVKTLRWVLAHEPVALFEPAAKEFARLVDAATGGEVRVDILSLSDYSPGKRLAMENVQEELKSGRLQMVQTPVVNLGSWHAPFWALESPFIFRSHEHAARVLDGETGQGLLDALRPHGLRGLAFTYSGGFRVLSSTSEKLEGLRVRTCHSPVAEATMRALGNQAVQAAVSQVGALTREGKIDAAETTWARYDAAHPVVHETGHSLLLTAIVLQESLFQGLSAAHREALLSAAKTVAKQERAFSVSEGERFRAAAMASGVKVLPVDRERLAARARRALPEIRRVCGGALLDAVEAQA